LPGKVLSNVFYPDIYELPEIVYPIDWLVGEGINGGPGLNSLGLEGFVKSE
jgi:hypothetical protein